MQTLV